MFHFNLACCQSSMAYRADVDRSTSSSFPNFVTCIAATGAAARLEMEALKNRPTPGRGDSDAGPSCACVLCFHTSYHFR